MLFSRKHPIGGMFLILFILTLPVAGHTESAIELNGFQLWQFKSMVHTVLGKPFKAIKSENATMEVYAMDEDAYMVFGYLKNWPNRIYMIQVTGRTNRMIPFQGLVLGDDAKKIRKLLGPTSSVHQIQKQKVKQTMELWKYKGTNYSVEVDEAGKLYGVQINLVGDLLTEVSDNDRHWEDFKQSILDKDVQGILQKLRPDVEIYRNGTYLVIQKPMAYFRSQPDPKFMSAFWGNSDSVLSELKVTEPQQEFRIHEKMGGGMVYKFYKGSILKEIVFFPFNGKYRVYEIRFRH